MNEPGENCTGTNKKPFKYCFFAQPLNVKVFDLGTNSKTLYFSVIVKTI